VTSHRRLLALAAIFAIAWGALWPLVSAARPRSPAIPNFICSQSGFRDGHPLPAAPRDSQDKFHCPLCVVTVEATLPVLPAGPSWIPVSSAPLAALAPTAPRACFEVRPPPSRAPPLC
jgi:hypothetical protein